MHDALKRNLEGEACDGDGNRVDDDGAVPTYTFGSDGLKQQEDLVLRVPGTEIALDVTALFADLDHKKNRQDA